MSVLDGRCTFHRDGQWCGRLREDESVHVWPDEPMRRGMHVWRHATRDAPALEDAMSDPVSDDERTVREKVAAIRAVQKKLAATSTEQRESPE